MKIYDWVGAYLHSFLTSSLDAGSCPIHAPVALTPGKVPPVHSRQGVSQSQSGPRDEKKSFFFNPLEKWTTVVHPVAESL
jgi:hypothetical protein